MEYCNENLKDVYHELFDEALARYNEKQTRSDRQIDDYYEKFVLVSRRSHSMKSFCKLGIRTIWAQNREWTACGKNSQ